MERTTLSLAHLRQLLLTGKRSEGKSPKTIAWYEDALDDFARWLERAQLPAVLASFTLDRVRAYAVDLQQRAARDPHKPGAPACASGRKLSDHTVDTYLRALRAFSNWLFAEGYTLQHTLARLKTPRLPEKAKDILTPEEIAQIAGSLNPHTEIGARDQAIFLLLLDSGMRLSELCGLCVEDLHLAEGYAKVYGKNKKERPVRVGSYSAKALRFYLLHWRKPARPSIETVFLTCRGVTRTVGALAPEPGEPLKPKAVELMLRRVGRAAGVPRLHPHLLRHTFSCHYLLTYRDPFALKSLLGHTTLAMTNHYVAAVQQMEIVKADSASVLDAMDLRALWNNRRGRLPSVKPIPPDTATSNIPPMTRNSKRKEG
jgi:site-specific recombinase XerD